MIKQFLGRLPKKSSKTAADGQDVASLGNSNGSRCIDGGTNKVENGKDLGLMDHNSSSSAGLSNGNKVSQVVDLKPSKNFAPDSFEALPTFREVPNSEKQNLFVKKLSLCCTVFDFSDVTKNFKEKEIKRQTLLELVDYLSSANGKFTEVVMQEVVKMVSANLFRPLISQSRENKISEAYDVEDDEPSMDPAWPHLQIVYELFLRFVASSEMDTKLAKRYIDHSFLIRLLDLFDSDDPREREYLKTILHRIYGKFMIHRPFIRKLINNVFYHFVFETEKFNGIAELLEVLGSIINGFALPLKEEHKSFLVHFLIPLHKPKCLPVYHQQLSYCISQFVEKDSKLADIVIRGLLKYWPVTNSSKEVMFLTELEEVLEAAQQPEFQRCMVPLFQRIARCISSSHFQVAERALYMWNNDHIDNLIRHSRKVILPIIFPALERNVRGHWNQVVKNLTINVHKIFSDSDPELFGECLRKFEEDEAKGQEIRAKQEAAWKRLEEMVTTKTYTNCFRTSPSNLSDYMLNLFQKCWQRYCPIFFSFHFSPFHFVGI